MLLEALLKTQIFDRQRGLFADYLKHDLIRFLDILERRQIAAFLVKRFRCRIQSQRQSNPIFDVFLRRCFQPCFDVSKGHFSHLEPRLEDLERFLGQSDGLVELGDFEG